MKNHNMPLHKSPSIPTIIATSTTMDISSSNKVQDMCNEFQKENERESHLTNSGVGRNFNQIKNNLNSSATRNDEIDDKAFRVNNEWLSDNSFTGQSQTKSHENSEKWRDAGFEIFEDQPTKMRASSGQLINHILQGDNDREEDVPKFCTKFCIFSLTSSILIVTVLISVITEAILTRYFPGRSGAAVVASVFLPYTLETPISMTIPVEKPPPTKGQFLFECKIPSGVNGSDIIRDACWQDSETLIAVQWEGIQIIKIQMDFLNKQCHTSIITRFNGYRVSCTKDRNFYVTFHGSEIWFFDKNHQKVETWNTPFLPEEIMVNKDFIVVTQHDLGPILVFDRDKNFIRNFTIANDKYNLYYSHLTADNLLVSTSGIDGYNLLIHNISKDIDTIVAGSLGSARGQFNDTHDVTVSSSGHILVCDHNNDRVSIWTFKGQFLHYLQYDVEGVVNYARVIAIYPRQGQPDLMALSGGNTIGIFILEN